eukprot:5595179-Amphidinium_carterae.1
MREPLVWGESNLRVLGSSSVNRTPTLGMQGQDCASGKRPVADRQSHHAAAIHCCNSATRNMKLKRTQKVENCFLIVQLRACVFASPLLLLALPIVLGARSEFRGAIHVSYYPVNAHSEVLPNKPWNGCSTPPWLHS